MRKKPAKQAPKPEPVAKEVGKVVGKVTMVPLRNVKKNSWNPNGMTKFERDSLKYGLEMDGWMASQALLIWGTDEKGVVQNVIIDGEHRHEVAGELGFQRGPMVFLDQLPEAQAKALTIKMNAKRGKFAELPLAEVVRAIQHELGDKIALNLGLEEDRIMKFLSIPEVVLDSGAEAVEAGGATSALEMPSGKLTQTKMVQLFFSADEHTEFMGYVQQMSEKSKKKTVSEVVLEGLRRAHSAKK